MMRQGNDARLFLARRTREKFMAQLPRRHLNGDFFCTRKNLNVPTSYRHGQPQCLRRTPNQLFIRIAGASAQLMIEMCHLQWPSVLARQHMQQHHGIHATGNRHQNFSPRR